MFQPVPALLEQSFARHRVATWLPRLAFCAALIACTTEDDDALQRRPRKPLEAFCQAHVLGVGIVDIENDYLPHVVQCENGGAPFASLKAQAVAARSYLYYKLETAGAINDGQSDQVYSCAGAPSAEQVLAVEETSGQVLTYEGETVCAFYVAGAKQVPPTCMGDAEHYTERFVTYNWGLSGGDILQSPLGLIHPENLRNRGCMSQWGSRCLADSDWMYLDILKFYYGADVMLETASGPCILASSQPPRGELESVTCDELRGWVQDPDDPNARVYVQFWFDGAPGSPQAHSVVVHATQRRDDPCTDSVCAHGFTLRTPLGLRDGTAHSVRVMALDTEGGIDAALEGSPTSFRCGPPVPTHLPSAGIRRRLESMDTLNAWSLTMVEDVVPLTDAELAEYPQGPTWPSSPDWVRRVDRGELWVVDTGTVRELPASAAAAWRIEPTSTRAWTDSEASLPRASSFPPHPFLVRGPAGDLYAIDSPLGAHR